MAPLKSFLNGFIVLFIHLGCLAIFSSPSYSSNVEETPVIITQKRRKITPISPSSSTSLLKPQKSLARSFLSSLSHLLSFRKHESVVISNNSNHDQPQEQQQQLPPPSPAAASLHSLLRSPLVSAESVLIPDKHASFAARMAIFPCSACGEVLAKPQLLEIHHATKHSLSELRDGDSGKNIVQIIFNSGWKGKPPFIHRILKIHNTTSTLARFEEYREIVRSQAARSRRGGDERCLADGNERLRFYCSTILCGSGSGSGSHVGVCGSPYCSTCAIVRHGFAGKGVDLEGIATHVTSWGAHVSLPDELEREFAFLHVRRAMLVCRVVAGRVARGGEEAEVVAVKGASPAFDSVVPVGRQEEEELLVFNPRAVLPCFVIIYSAS